MVGVKISQKCEFGILCAVLRRNKIDKCKHPAVKVFVAYCVLSRVSRFTFRQLGRDGRGL